MFFELHHRLETFESYWILKLYLRIIEKLMIAFSSKVIVNSEFFRRELESIYGKNIIEKVYVVPNSVSTREFRYRRLAKTKPAKQIVGFIGSLSLIGYLLLVNYFCLPRRRFSSAPFLLCSICLVPIFNSYYLYGGVWDLELPRG